MSETLREKLDELKQTLDRLGTLLEGDQADHLPGMVVARTLIATAQAGAKLGKLVSLLAHAAETPLLDGERKAAKSRR